MGIWPGRHVAIIADGDGLEVANLLTPIPEPATLALVAFGALGAPIRRRRT